MLALQQHHCSWTAYIEALMCRGFHCSERQPRFRHFCVHGGTGCRHDSGSSYIPPAFAGRAALKVGVAIPLCIIINTIIIMCVHLRWECWVDR